MEGPLVSDTTEFLSGAADAPGETPLGRPASPVNADPEGSHAGSGALAGSDGAAAARGRRRQGTGLSALLLPELQQVAQQMGIAGTARMRKSQLIAAIQEKQGGNAEEPRRGSRAGAPSTEVSAPRAASAGADASRPLKQDAMEPQTSTDTGIRRNGRDGNGVPTSARGDAGGQQLSFDQASASDTSRAAPGASSPQAAQDTATEAVRGDGQQPADGPRGDRRRRGNSRDGQQSRGREGNGRDTNRGDGNRGDGNRGDNGRGDRNRDGGQDRGGAGAAAARNDQYDDDGDGDGRRRRRDRFRNRNRRRERRRPGRRPEPDVREDDVLIPIAGILDVLDNYAFVRTSGYLPGPNDVYVSLSLVRKHGLRRVT